VQVLIAVLIGCASRALSEDRMALKRCVDAFVSLIRMMIAAVISA